MGARRSPATIDSVFKTGRNKHFDKVDHSKAFLSTQKIATDYQTQREFMP